LKKKAKIDKIKTLSSEKKAGGLELQKPTGTAAAGATRPAAMKEKAEGAARKKAPAPRMKTLSPTALMMKFPLNSTLPSVASLKARFARFGPLDVDGIRVYWKSNMCRVIYRFRSDAETALKYARTNPMFGQVDAQFHIKEVETSGGSEPPPALDAPLQRSSDLRLMETAPFRPGTSGSGSPLPMSRAVPARTVATAMGQLQPKSILKKSTDEGGSVTREGSSRVKFMLDAGDNKLEPSAPPTSSGNGGDSGAPVRVKSVGFAPQPPMRPAQQPLQPPRAAVTQPLPPPPPMPYQARTSDGLLPPQGQLPYPPRHTDGPPAFSTHPSQQQLLLYPPRHNDGMSALPGQPPLPYQPRSAGFPSQQPQPYPPHSSQPMLIGQPQQYPPSRPGTSAATEDVPAWKTSKEEFKNEVWRVMTRIAELVEPLTDKNGFFPYHLFGGK
jgi:DNA (cytosine-5)-methyltransferase 3A